MRKIFSMFILCAMLISYVPKTSAEENVLPKNIKIEIHVSPNGNDSNPGTEELPLKSFEGARKAVSKINTGKNPIDVIFHEGVYRFSETVYMKQGDSGTEKAPITYRSAEGEKVFFKGSQLLDSKKFTPVKDKEIYNRLPYESAPYIGQMPLDSAKITVGTIPVGKSGDDLIGYNQLYLENQMQTLSRWPNDGYTVMDRVIEKDMFLMKEANATRWGNVKDAYLGGYPSINYAYDRTKVTGVDTVKRNITIDKSRTTYGIGQEGRYYIYNLLEEIDMPGEWYIDKENMILYYYPMYPLEGKELEISTLRTPMFQLDGLSYVNFEGITFSQTCGKVFYIQTANNIIWNNNEYRDLGHWVISGNSLKSSTISNSNFVNIASNPIDISGGNLETLESSEIVVYNNYFNNFGYERRSYSGVVIRGVGTKVLHNVFCGAYGAALQLHGNNHEIMYNEIYDVCNEASDMGAIYAGRNLYYRGNKVMYNYIHDIIPDPRTAGLLCGVYWDDKLSGNMVQYNIFENIPRGVFMNGGSDHVVKNNIFVDCPSGIQVSTAGNSANALQDYFISALDWANKYPVYYEQYPEMQTLDIEYTLPRRNEFCDNLYINTGNYPIPETEYIKYGEGDYKSRFENNIHFDTFEDFNDSQNGDYTVKEGSKLLDKLPELAKINMEKIGLEGEMKEKWKPDNFRKIAPKNGMTDILTQKALLTWQIPDNACNYRVVVATDPELKNVVWETTTKFNYAKPENIESGGKTYYWNVFASTNSGTNPMEYPATGAVYCFTTTVLEKLEQTILTETIKSAEKFVAGAVEGEKGGELQYGTLQPFIDLLEVAKQINKKPYGAQLEVDEINEQLISKQSAMARYIHKEYAEYDKYFSDISKWQGDAEINDGIMTIKSGYVSTVNDTENYEVFRFKFKMTNNKGFATIGLRQNVPGTPWNTGMVNYTVFIKKDIFEFQRYTGHGGGIIETKENKGIVAEDKWHEIEIASIDVQNGIRFVFKVDGQEIFNYLDESGLINEPGMLQFGLVSTDMVEIKASDNNEPFDESVFKTGVKTYAADELVVEKEELLKPENYMLTRATAEITSEGVMLRGSDKKNNIAFSKKCEGNEIYTFDAKLNIEGGMQGFNLRSSYLEQSPENEEGYKIEIDNETVSLIRYSAMGNQVLCILDNNIIKSGEWNNYKLCSYPTESGMRVMMYVNSNQLIDYTDMYLKIQNGYLKFIDETLNGIEIR